MMAYLNDDDDDESLQFILQGTARHILWLSDCKIPCIGTSNSWFLSHKLPNDYNDTWMEKETPKYNCVSSAGSFP
jgi:hypothetical protein